ncbi:MAG: OmpA family protein [Myxococcota bacterium]
MNHRWIVVVASGLLSGCLVSQKKYDALEQDYNRLQVAYQDLKDATQQKDAEIVALKGQIEVLKTQDSALAGFYEDVLDDMEHMLRSGRISIGFDEGRLQVSAREGIMFGTGDAGLLLEGERVINAIARVMNETEGRRFQIEGHADARPINNGDYSSNWELASARAIAVTEALIDAGVDPRKLSAASFGEHQPVDSNDTLEGMARNRRIDVVLIPDLSDLEESQRLIERADTIHNTAPEEDPMAPSDSDS